MIKNIIFDVGKVLVEWNPQSAFRKLGFDEKTQQAVAEATIHSADWNEYDRSVLSDEEQLAFFIRKAPEYGEQIRLFWKNIGLSIRQFEYAKPWIKELKEQGFHIYILSNYARWTYANTTEALSFLDEVDGQVFSFEVHQIKPEPEIYQTIISKYKLIPSECVFIDDRLENLVAAEAAGIKTIHFTNKAKAAQKLEDFKS